MVGLVVAVIVAYFLGPISAVGFVVGSILSGAAGFIGMNISVRSNLRTAAAAQTGLQQGLTLAFRAGAITGMLVAGLALLAISGFFYVLVGPLGHEPNSREVTTRSWPSLSGVAISIFAVCAAASSPRRGFAPTSSAK